MSCNRNTVKLNLKAAVTLTYSLAVKNSVHFEVATIIHQYSDISQPYLNFKNKLRKTILL